MCPCGNEPSGSRSKVVDGWMAGVTAPVAGSTAAPACTATVSILMASPSAASYRALRRRHGPLLGPPAHAEGQCPVAQPYHDPDGHDQHRHGGRLRGVTRVVLGE